MLGGLTGWHAVIILAVVLLLFGATRLPALAKSLGQSMRVFKDEVKSGSQKDSGADSTTESSETSDPNPKP